jgi:hypothetical protein
MAPAGSEVLVDGLPNDVTDGPVRIRGGDQQLSLDVRIKRNMPRGGFHLGRSR